MAKYNGETENGGINLIGLGTDIKGNINSNSDIRIDGSLNGNLNTTGKVVIGESGFVKGEITCKNGDVSGKVEGKINVSELLSLKASSQVYGDMIVNKLSVEPGCVFTGNCKMDSKSINVELKKSEKEEYDHKAKAV